MWPITIRLSINNNHINDIINADILLFVVLLIILIV